MTKRDAPETAGAGDPTARRTRLSPDEALRASKLLRRSISVPHPESAFGAVVDRNVAAASIERTVVDGFDRLRTLHVAFEEPIEATPAFVAAAVAMALKLPRPAPTPSGGFAFVDASGAPRGTVRFSGAIEGVDVERGAPAGASRATPK